MVKITSSSMWFFFLGGVRQVVSKVLLRNVARCLRCQSPASFVNYVNVLELFYIPIWRWPGRNPALFCERCAFLLPTGHFQPMRSIEGREEEDEKIQPGHTLHCWSCARVLEPIYKYCPECGSKQEEF